MDLEKLCYETAAVVARFPLPIACVKDIITFSESAKIFAEVARNRITSYAPRNRNWLLFLA